MKVLGFVDPYNANFENRIIRDEKTAEKRVKSIKDACDGECKIVLTQGSFDMFHVGHGGYLGKARTHGDLLIVGVDSDAKVRKRKGIHRPVVPEEERMEVICHTRYADLVVLKNETSEKWALIKAVQPDILIATQETYTDDEIAQLENGYCGKVVVLPPQAETSTTAKIRKLMIGGLDDLSKVLSVEFPEFLQSCIEKIIGGHEKPKKEDKK